MFQGALRDLILGDGEAVCTIEKRHRVANRRPRVKHGRKMLTAIVIRRGEMTMMSALCAKKHTAKSSSHHHVRVQIDLRPLSFEDREPPRAPWNT